MSKRRIWMPLYIGDYLADTAALNATGSGAYLHLIMHYWLHGSLPDNDRELAEIAKLTPYQWKKFRNMLQKYFLPGWRHKRIDRELQRAEEKSGKRARAGVIGAATRWQKPSSAHGNAMPTVTYIPSSTVERVRAPARSKKEASRAKEDLKPTPELLETMDRKNPKH